MLMSKEAKDSNAVKSAVFMLTNSCNLRCDYCFEYEHAARHMSKETAHRSIRWLLSNAEKQASITLFGGEPLIRKDFIPWLINTAQAQALEMKKKVTFSMTTNGTLLDREIGEVLKKAKVHIQLSADGNAKAHDIHRKFANNQGSYHLVEKAIPIIKEICPYPSVRMTVTPKNVQGMAEGVEHFVNLGFNTVHPVPMQEDDWTPETRKIFAENLEKTGAFFISSLMNDRFLSIHGITDVIQRATHPSKNYLCGAGRTIVAIDTDGALFPCQRFLGYTYSGPKWKMGDVWEDFEKEKRDYFFDLTVDKVKSCKEKEKESKGLCQGCDIYKICSGGCPAINELENGDPLAASSSYQAFKSMSIDEVHGIITFLQSKYPEIWEKYVSRLSNANGHKNPR